MMVCQMSPPARPRASSRVCKAAVAKALREPEWWIAWPTLGMDLRENGTGDYVKFMRDDIDRYRTAIRTLQAADQEKG